MKPEDDETEKCLKEDPDEEVKDVDTDVLEDVVVERSDGNEEEVLGSGQTRTCRPFWVRLPSPSS